MNLKKIIMKGFIEVNKNLGYEFSKHAININHIIHFEDGHIVTSYSNKFSVSEELNVKETYEEIKELIKKAQ